MGSPARFFQDEDANTSLLFAFALPAILVLMAFVVDLSAVGIKKRELQSASDLAAIVAAQNLDAFNTTALVNLAANGFETQSVETGHVQEVGPEVEGKVPATKANVEAGRYRPDATVLPELRFTAGGSPVNAVRVTATHKASLYFGARLISAPELSARSVAYVSSEAAFTVGTRLVHLNGGIANKILNATLGTDVELSVMDYDSLLDADVSLFETLDALASEVNLDAVTYEDVLQADITLGQLSEAMSGLSDTGSRASYALDRIAHDRAARNTTLRLADLLDLGSLALSRLGTIEGPYSVRVQALDFLQASAGLGNGEHQIDLDLSADVPGISSLQLTMLVGERPQSSPWLAVADLDSVVVHTAQTRLLLQADIDGLAALTGTSISLPIYAELGSATASLSQITCPNGREDQARVDLDVTPSVASLWIGQPAPANLQTFDVDYPVYRARLVDTPILDVLGRSRVAVGSESPQQVSFSAQDVLDGTVKTVSSHDLLNSTVGSLLGNLDLTVRAVGLSINTPSKTQAALVSTLDPLTASLDGVLDTVLSIAGVSLGEAEVRASGLACQRAVLVQ